MCECTHGSRASHGVHLVDAEQFGRGQDRGVNSKLKVTLRGRDHGNRRDTRHLRGNDVHHDTRRIDGLAAWNVETHTRNGNPTLFDRGTRTEGGHG